MQPAEIQEKAIVDLEELPVFSETGSTWRLLMKNKNFDSSLYLFAGILFLAAGFIGSQITFYVIGICMFILGMTKKSDKK